MKFTAKSMVLLVLASASLLQAQIRNFGHVIIIVQENRTPDNLFQGLCTPPYGTAASCSTSPAGKQYDIQTKNWLDKTSATGVTQPTTAALASKYDLDHAHHSWVTQCDKDATGNCRMDGAARVQCKGTTCPVRASLAYVDNSTGILNPYLHLASQYGWANAMFQTIRQTTTDQAAADFYPGYAHTFTEIGKERGWPPTTRAQFDAVRGPTGALLIGDAETVAEKILYDNEVLGGISRITFQMGVSTLPHQKMLHAIEILGERVAPIVRKELAAGGPVRKVASRKTTGSPASQKRFG